MRDDTIVQLIEDEDFDQLFRSLKSHIESLLTCVHVVVVLDGNSLPQKAATLAVRRSKVNNAVTELRSIISLETEIPPEQRLALTRKCFSRTPALNSALIDFFFNLAETSRNLSHKLSFIISPYEADAQLTFLNREGIVDVAVTMDADLVIFGAKKILFPPSKGMHNFFGECLLYDSTSLFLSNPEIQGSLKQFQDIACTSGLLGLALVAISTNRNDYLPESLGGLSAAIRNVHSMIPPNTPLRYQELIDSIFSEDAVTAFLEGCLNRHQLATSIGLDKFKTAIVAYFGQVIYDFRSQSQRPLYLSSFRTAGNLVDSNEAVRQAHGYTNLDMITNLRAKALNTGANFLLGLVPGDRLPDALVPHMLEGAILPFDSSQWTVSSMGRFLEIHRYLRPLNSLLTQLSEGELKQACIAQIKANRAREIRNQLPLIQSTFGFSLRDFYNAAEINFESRGKELSETDRCFTARTDPIPLNLSSKRNGIVALASQLPIISDFALTEWYGIQEGSTTLSLVKGWKIYFDFLQMRDHLQLGKRKITPGDQIIQRRDLSDQPIDWEADTRQLIRISSKCPATMKKDLYSPCFIALIETNPNQLLKILDASCTCKAQKGMKCPHVAALLYTVQRWPQSDEEKEKDDRWKTPSANSACNTLVPIAELSFFKPSRNRERKRFHPAHSPEAVRQQKKQRFIEKYKTLSRVEGFTEQKMKLYQALRRATIRDD